MLEYLRVSLQLNLYGLNLREQNGTEEGVETFLEFYIYNVDYAQVHTVSSTAMFTISSNDLATNHLHYNSSR